MAKKKKKKIEFSKLLLIIGLVLSLIVMAFSMALMWKTMDTSPLSYLIPSVFGLVATGFGFYYKKAERENLIKIKNKYGEEIVEDIKSLEDENTY